MEAGRARPTGWSKPDRGRRFVTAGLRSGSIDLGSARRAVARTLRGSTSSGRTRVLATRLGGSRATRLRGGRTPGVGGYLRSTVRRDVGAGRAPVPAKRHPVGAHRRRARRSARGTPLAPSACRPRRLSASPSPHRPPCAWPDPPPSTSSPRQPWSCFLCGLRFRLRLFGSLGLRLPPRLCALAFISSRFALIFFRSLRLRLFGGFRAWPLRQPWRSPLRRLCAWPLRRLCAWPLGRFGLRLFGSLGLRLGGFAPLLPPRPALASSAALAFASSAARACLLDCPHPRFLGGPRPRLLGRTRPRLLDRPRLLPAASSAARASSADRANLSLRPHPGSIPPEPPDVCDGGRRTPASSDAWELERRIPCLLPPRVARRAPGDEERSTTGSACREATCSSIEPGWVSDERGRSGEQRDRSPGWCDHDGRTTVLTTSASATATASLGEIAPLEPSSTLSSAPSAGRSRPARR